MSTGGSQSDTTDIQKRQMAPTDWWRTSFRGVSWSYPTNRSQRSPRTLRPPVIKPLVAGSGVHPRPPHYHNLLYRTECRRTVEDVQGDLELNSGLAGVKGVEDSIGRYEHDVGITLSVPDTPPTERPLFRGVLSEDELALAQSQWHHQFQELLGGVRKRLSTSFEEIVAGVGGPDSKVWDLSLLDSPELSDSELSAESDPPPSTPRASPSSLSSVSTQCSADFLQPHPIPLSAKAATFVPSPSSLPKSPSPTHEFAFPSLNADNPAASPAARKRSLLLKDGDGFYHSTESDVLSPSARSSTPRRPSADLLPAFLADNSSSVRSRARNPSRTREMVERLRSGRWTGKKSPSNKTSSTSLDSKPREESKERSGSSERSSTSSQMSADADGWISGPSKTPEDGWIEGVPSPSPSPSTKPVQKESRPRSQKHAHKRSASSASSLSTAASAPSPATPLQTTLPAAVGFYPVPPPPLNPMPFVFGLPPRTPGMSEAQYLMQIQKLQQDHWSHYMRFSNMGGFTPSPYMTFPPAPAVPVVYSPK